MYTCFCLQYGTVYCGLWQGTEVAIKTIMLPAGMTGAQKREKMAIMEAAISSTLSHPNIIQTFTWSIRPYRDQSLLTPRESAMVLESAGSSERISASSSVQQRSSSRTLDKVQSYEVRLVLELCDRGSLRDALEDGAFLIDSQPGPGGEVLLNYPAVLDMAMDIAKACIHLHRNDILHCDLKARNVLLRATGGTGKGVVAKLGDFGLAVKLAPGKQDVEGVFQVR